MAINEERSYTEYNVEVPTTDFPIGFDILDDGIDVVAVTLNDVDPTTLGYTVIQVNNTTYRFAPAVPSGVVRLTRITDIDQMAHVFTEGAIFISENMDGNFKQIRHSQQEVRDQFIKLETDTGNTVTEFTNLVTTIEGEFQVVQADTAAALATATEAKGIAEGVDAKATTALSNSSTALATANAIDAKASTALSNSADAVASANTALSTANTAQSTANAIDAKATSALSTANATASTVDGVVVGGAVPDAKVKAWAGATQEVENKAFVTTVANYAALSGLAVVDGRTVYVKAQGQGGEFKYVAASVKAHDGGTVIVDGSNRRWERINLASPKLRWWGAVGDNVVNDDAAYLAAVAFYVSTGIIVDGEGLTYKTNSRGSVLTAIKNATINATSGTLIFDQVGNMQQINSGRDWEKGMTEYSLVRFGGGAKNANGFQRGVTAIGQGAFQNIQTSNIGGIAIGANTLSQMTDANAAGHNIAIGDSALTNTIADGSSYGGTRNVAVGSLAGHFNRYGYMNVWMGRDAGHNNMDGIQNVAIGYTAGVSGTSPIGWSGGIEMQFGGMSYSYNVSIGCGAAYWGGQRSVSLGFEAIKNVKAANANVAIGYLAGTELDKNISYTGTIADYDLNISATYTISGSNVVFALSSLPAIGLAVGDTVAFNVTTGSLTVESGKAVVTAISGNNVTIALPVVGATGTGAASLKRVVRVAAASTIASGSNVLIGFSAAAARKAMQDNVVIGTDAFASSGTGQSAGNVLIGARAARDRNQLTECTAVGLNALRFATTGAVTDSYTNSTCIGSDSRVGGDNQVQLGSSTTTTYVYGTVQNRSDLRDKADVEAMPDLMTQFILELNPVQGRWDMRDDYVDDHPVDWTDEQKKEWWANPVKDGSKKRNRLHNWFIAQEVKALSERLGIDFAGLQEHKLIDGADTMSIGYEEFIPPIVATIQKLSKRMDEIEQRLNALEN